MAPKVSVFLLVAAFALCLPFSASASVVDLGAAGDYVLLAAGYPYGARAGTMILGSASEPLGNTGAWGTLLIGPASHIGGNLDYGGYASIAAGVSIDGQKRKLSSSQWQIIRGDLVLASQAAAAMAGVSMPSITAGLVLSSESDGLTVVNINGGIYLGAGEKLVLRGGANDRFVINFTGGLDLGPGAGIVLDGVMGQNVLFNMYGGNVDSSPIARMDRAELNGVFLAPDRFWIIGDGMRINARVLVSGVQANIQTIEPPTVPAPAALALLICGAVTLLRRPHKK